MRVGISACLLGEPVRFDGGHKRNTFLTDTLGRFVTWVPVCPEVECGLGAPRESLRLVRDACGRIRLVGSKTTDDLTAHMDAFADQRVTGLERHGLSGFVLKKDSPSCGMERVKVYTPGGVPERSGRGVFAARLMDRMPHLPVEEEGRLHDPRLRENFVERVFAYARVHAFFGFGWTLGALVRFHTGHKLQLMAHSPQAYAALGRLIASARSLPREHIVERYVEGFMRALAIPASPKRQTNVLQHMAGYFKTRLDARSKAELVEAIDDYRRGLVPLVVPLALIRHHIQTHQVEYLATQLYIQPHPKELMLRNHV